MMTTQLIVSANSGLLQDYLVAQFGPELYNHPDIIHLNREEEVIKIAQIRNIAEQLSFRPIKNAVKTIVIHRFDLATTPAQNALLKSLEEPPEYIQFILSVVNLRLILPTVQSRCELINYQSNLDVNKSTLEIDPSEQIFSQLEKSSFAEKIELAANYKDRAQATELITNLLFFVHHKNQLEPSQKLLKNLDILSECLSALQQNSNVLLTLEKCFFDLKSRF